MYGANYNSRTVFNLWELLSPMYGANVSKIFNLKDNKLLSPMYGANLSSTDAEKLIAAFKPHVWGKSFC